MKRMPRTALLLALGLALAGAGFLLGQRSSQDRAAGTAASADARQVLYWHDPMVPGPRFDKPGKSPFMDMQLVPVYAGSDTSASAVQMSPAVQQNLGIRYATVRRAQAASSFDAIGTVQFDARLNVAVQTRVAGYVEQLAVRAPMEHVRKGQALVTIFAPDWLGPQNEWLALQRTGAAPELIAAARDRMRALSIPADLVRRSEEAGSAQARFTLSAPRSGVVTELGIREGVAVSPGMTLFRIAGLDKVWAVAEVPEAQVLALRRGQKVKARLQADGAQTFEGELKEILPEVSANTRTLQARFEVENQNGQLTPGMLLRLQIAGPASSRLLVPAEAVIRTGQRAVVIVRQGVDAFAPREITLGLELGEDIEVVQGLREGDEVVASGQFLIDSEARLRSVLGSLSASAAPPANTSAAPAEKTAATHMGQGKVESVEPDSMTISHGPVATLQWPSMTMGFAKPSAQDFPDVKPGDTVRFAFEEDGAGYRLRSVQRLPSGKQP